MSFADIAALTIHDVKNRLAHLAGRAEARGDSDTLRSALEASEALTHLLVFYKSETGILNLAVDGHSPADLVADLALESREHQTIRLDVDCSEAPTLGFYDEVLVRMVLSNALHNALRFARQRVLISVAGAGENIEFSVRDDGAGYPESVLADQGSSASITRDGTGLGLRLAKRIARMHENGGRHGDTRLFNLDGAVFQLTLPK